MSEKIVSPGVFVRETDLSYVEQGIANIGAAIVAPFPKGPAFVPMTVETQADFRAHYGVPDGIHYGQYTAEEYLRENGRVTIVRVGGLGGYAQTNALELIVTGSGIAQKTVAVLFSTKENAALDGFATSTIETASFGTTFATTKDAYLTISGASVTTAAYSMSLDPRDANYIKNIFGTNPLGSKSAYNFVVFEDFISELTGSNAAPVTMSVNVLGATTSNYTYDVTNASTPYIISQLISGERYQLFKFHTLSDGTYANRQYKVAIDTVRSAGSVSNTNYGTFNITLRELGDTDERPVIIETFQGVTLDPNSPNYIAKQIGTRQVTVDSNGVLSETGDYANRSKYIRVEVKDSATYPVNAVPAGFEAFKQPVNGTSLPAVTYTTGSLLSPYVKYSGFDFTRSDNHNYLNPLPETQAVGNNVSFSLDTTLSLIITGSTQSATDLNKRKFAVAFQGGFDGLSPIVSQSIGANITAANTLGFDCSSATASGSVAYIRALNAISNPDEFDINLLVTPGIIRNLHPSITTKAIDVCEIRADCFYIADLVGRNATITDVLQQAEQVNTSYAAAYYPWPIIRDVNTNKAVAVPPSTVMAGVFAASDRLGNEWAAPAGLNRGGISAAEGVVTRLSHSNRDDLYSGKVNPIASFPGQRISAFGQKTLQNRASALDRINVRRLLLELRKFVASTSRFLIFEPNTEATRRKFLGTVNPYMETVKAKQGLFDYKIVMDSSNNTPDVIDRNILKGQILIQPTRIAEYIVLDFDVLPTGASFR